MHSPYYKWHLSGQIYLLLSATRILSLIPCCNSYYSLFCWRISFHSHKLSSDMPESGYKRNDSSRMFLQSVRSAHYLDISYTYMLLTPTAITFLSLIFYVFPEHFLYICFDTSSFFLYLHTKIMWYYNKYLCLFLDFHVPIM